MKKELIRKDRVIIVGDFNCKEIVWEDYEVVNGGGISLKEEIEHECPLGKNDHDVLSFELDTEISTDKIVEHREEKLIYIRANYNHMREFFNEIDWSVVYQEGDM
ncbi:hypothetical protein E2C01_102220 [Portunus trituberculatus]|uniref:Endonuclease/exonuclease/phosphatase domain-containing protein n=1 Tax=Portunus trituberculatus TaxID=210409 RepID=A0A5B7KHV6_PORTR|nr:hypothetical protein [Portunus trituberculatus]